MTAVVANDTGPSRSGWRDPVRWLMACLILATTLSVGLVVARCCAVFGVMQWFSTSGEEGTVIYGVWKSAHAHTIYQIPAAGLYESSIYNFLFYQVYGGFCSLIGADGDHLVMASRLLTCSAGLVGAFAQWRVLGLLLPGPLNTRERRLLLMLVALTWYGGSFMNWWLVTVRPDVPAVALSMLGLWVWLLAMRRSSSTLAATAALPFYCAWAFKQSVVWSLTGAVIGGLSFSATRRVALVLAFCAGAAFAATVLLGGEAYRYQTLYVSSLFAWSLWQGILRSQQMLVPLMLFWLFALLPWLTRRCADTRDLFPLEVGEHRRAQRVVGIACLIAVLMGVIAFGKEGSGHNHLMEGAVLVSTLGAANLVRVLRMKSGNWRNGFIILASVLALVLCGRPNHSLFLDDSGINHGNASDVWFHRELEQVVATLPKPAYVDDDILAQPWYANDNRYPGYVPDILMYMALKRHHKITDGGLSYLVSHGKIQSILVRANPTICEELLNPALLAGFARAPLPETLAAVGYELLVRQPRQATAP